MFKERYHDVIEHVRPRIFYQYSGHLNTDYVTRFIYCLTDSTNVATMELVIRMLLYMRSHRGGHIMGAFGIRTMRIKFPNVFAQKCQFFRHLYEKRRFPLSRDQLQVVGTTNYLDRMQQQYGSNYVSIQCLSTKKNNIERFIHRMSHRYANMMSEFNDIYHRNPTLMRMVIHRILQPYGDYSLILHEYLDYFPENAVKQSILSHTLLMCYLGLNSKQSWMQERYWLVFHEDFMDVPFSYRMPTKSPYWHGPPISYYEGPIGAIRPGICDMETFQQRLEAFIGSAMYHILRTPLFLGTVCLVGSCIPACAVKRVPVPGLSWEDYISSTYADSDVDMIIERRMFSQYVERLSRIHAYLLTRDDVDHFEVIRSSVYYYSDISTLSEEEFAETVREFYEPEGLYHQFLSRINITEEMRAMMVDMSPTIHRQDMHMYHKEYREAYRHEDTYIRRGFMCDNIRIKYWLRGAPRPFEIFWTPNSRSMVGRFHLPCVRAYYDVSMPRTLVMHPSFIDAMKTGCNQDYKYFASSRAPMNIIHKYHRRGFGTLLNRVEMEQYQAYLTENGLSSPVWPMLDEDVSENVSIYTDTLDDIRDPLL